MSAEATLSTRSRSLLRTFAHCACHCKTLHLNSATGKKSLACGTNSFALRAAKRSTSKRHSTRSTDGIKLNSEGDARGQHSRGGASGAWSQARCAKVSSPNERTVAAKLQGLTLGTHHLQRVHVCVRVCVCVCVYVCVCVCLCVCVL